MGLFDFRCPLSGLSLRAARAVHIALVESTPGAWRPLSLPLQGHYDRGGSIDGFTPDLHTDLLVAGFVRATRAGRVVAASVAGEYADFTRAPTIERLLHAFERVNTMSRWGAMPFTLDGRQLRQVLIHAEVFAALAPPPDPAPPPSLEAIEQQLAAAPLADQGREFHEELILAADAGRTAAAAALTRLTRLDRWLADHGRHWTPVAESGQYYPDDDLKFAREASTRLAHDPLLHPVVDRIRARLEATVTAD